MVFAAILSDNKGDGMIIIGLSHDEAKSLYDHGRGPTQHFHLATAIAAAGPHKHWNISVIQASDSKELSQKLRGMFKEAGIKDEQIQEINLTGKFH